MIQDVWLAKHPYLQPVADLHALIDATTAEILVPNAHLPTWEDYTADFHAGIPLLRSPRVAIDLRHVERGITSLVKTMSSRPLPGKLADETRILDAQLHGDQDSPRRAVACCSIKIRSRPQVRACFGTWDGPFWLDIFTPWYARSADGAKRNAGSAITAPPVERRPRWLSWSAPILGASDSSLAVVVKHVGIIGEPFAPSAKTRTIIN